jgi:hypothetical protein
VKAWSDSITKPAATAIRYRSPVAVRGAELLLVAGAGDWVTFAVVVLDDTPDAQAVAISTGE